MPTVKNVVHYGTSLRLPLGLDWTGKDFIHIDPPVGGGLLGPRPDAARRRIFFATLLGAGPFPESVLFECYEDLLDGPLLLRLVTRFDGFL